jgi:hypothetical protein
MIARLVVDEFTLGKGQVVNCGARSGVNDIISGQRSGEVVRVWAKSVEIYLVY